MLSQQELRARELAHVDRSSIPQKSYEPRPLSMTSISPSGSARRRWFEA